MILNLEFFHHEKEELAKYWNIAAENDWQRNSEWTLETVKHLAVINTAALAGSAALLAAKVMDGIHIKISLILFLLGLLSAVADFYFFSLGYLKRAEKYKDLSNKIKRSKSHNNLNDAFKNTSFKKEIFFKISSCLGWLSITVASIGIALIAYQLSTNA